MKIKKISSYQYKLYKFCLGVIMNISNENVNICIGMIITYI